LEFAAKEVIEVVEGRKTIEEALEYLKTEGQIFIDAKLKERGILIEDGVSLSTWSFTAR